MKKVFEEIFHYALGKKGNFHKVKNGIFKENKNVTKVQDFLDEYRKR